MEKLDVSEMKDVQGGDCAEAMAAAATTAAGTAYTSPIGAVAAGVAAGIWTASAPNDGCYLF